MGNKNISDLENQLDIIFESLSNILLINQKVPNKENIEQIKYFCEKEVIKNIIILSSYKQKEINLKIIKYISIYISNSSINDDKNKFNFFKCICEKEYLNQLIIKLNYNLEEKDDDYLSYYINFLKVINNKINSDNIKIIKIAILGNSHKYSINGRWFNLIKDKKIFLALFLIMISSLFNKSKIWSNKGNI